MKQSVGVALYIGKDIPHPALREFLRQDVNRDGREKVGGLIPGVFGYRRQNVQELGKMLRVVVRLPNKRNVIEVSVDLMPSHDHHVAQLDLAAKLEKPP